MKAVLFCRVSSKEQEETGYSLPSQEKLLTEYCQSKGFEIGKIFSLSESAGGSKQRKIFLEMLEYLKKNKQKILIVEKTDRLTRNMKDAVAVNNWIEDDEEKQIHFVKENFILHKNSKSNEKFVWGIKVTVAQYYLDNLSEEVKKGQKEKLRQGWLPGKAPYGYKTIGDKGRKTHVIDENIGPLIRKMFELYATGSYSLEKLTSKMLELGLRSTGGKKIYKGRIDTLLKDPFYVGQNVWRGNKTKGNQEPLIDIDTFNKVQRILASKNTPKYSKHDYLFKGLIKCNVCGGTITWEQHKGIVYGHCNHYRKCTVGKKWTTEKTIEDKLINELGNLQITNVKLMNWLERALKESNQTESNFYMSSINELEKQREVLKKRLDAIYIDKIDDKISKEYYDQKFKEFSEQLETIDQNISRHTKATNSGQDNRIALYSVAQRGKENYLICEPTEKQKLIRLTFKNLRMENEKVFFELQDDFKLLKELVTKTNSSKLGKLIDNKDKIFEQYNLTKTSKYYASSEPNCSALLRLVDAFCNHKIEFSVNLQLLQNFFTDWQLTPSFA